MKQFCLHHKPSIEADLHFHSLILDLFLKVELGEKRMKMFIFAGEKCRKSLVRG